MVLDNSQLIVPEPNQISAVFLSEQMYVLEQKGLTGQSRTLIR